MKRILIYLTLLFALFYNIAKAQTNGSFKSVRFYNVPDSAVFLSTTFANFISQYPNSGCIYYNEQSNKFRVYQNGVWGDIGGAGGGGTGNLIGTLTTPRIPYATGTNTLSDDANLFWNNTNKFLTIGNSRYSTFGNSNLFIGQNSGNTSIGIGLENLGIGTNALSSITIGNRHTAIGYNAGTLQTGGSNNTFVGNASGRLNTGSSNTFVGYATGENTTGSNNTSVGNGALRLNTIGILNTVLGSGAMAASVTTSGNTALGGNTLGALTSGTFNVAIGGSASSTGTTMNNSVAIGTNAQFNVSGGGSNIAIGVEAMSGTGTFGSGPNTGSNNVFVGHNSGDFMQSGSTNTAIGSGSMAGANTGSNNTALGNQTLTNINGGNYNISIGSGSGIGLTSGSNNVLIGQQITAQSNTGSNQLSIMNAIFGTGNLATGTSVSTGNIGLYTVNPTARLHLPAGQILPNTAPLKIPEGPLNTTPENGAIEVRPTSGIFTGVKTGIRYDFIQGLNGIANFNLPYLDGNSVLTQSTIFTPTSNTLQIGTGGAAARIVAGTSSGANLTFATNGGGQNFNFETTSGNAPLTPSGAATSLVLRAVGTNPFTFVNYSATNNGVVFEGISGTAGDNQISPANTGTYYLRLSGSNPTSGNGGDLILKGGTGGGGGNNGNIIILSLPTSAAGLPSGALWNDSGTLKIAP